jgi:hypothetical protein
MSSNVMSLSFVPSRTRDVHKLVEEALIDLLFPTGIHEISVGNYAVYLACLDHIYRYQNLVRLPVCNIFLVSLRDPGVQLLWISNS